MKTFEFFSYDRDLFPMATSIENLVNNSGSAKEHLEKIEKMITAAEMKDFVFACIGYWSQAQNYDARNRYAVLASRRIIEKYPRLKKINYKEKNLREAYGFTSYAHRYLQNEFFKVAMLYLKKNATHGIAEWFESQEFVYNKTENALIPYKEYLETRYQS